MDVRKVRRGKGYEAWYKGAWDEDDKGGEKAALAAEASQTAEKKGDGGLHFSHCNV